MTSSEQQTNQTNKEHQQHKIKGEKKMKVFMTLPAGAPAEGIKVVVEGNLLRLYFDYKKVEEATASTDGSTVKNGNSEDTSYSAENIDIDGGMRDYASITAAIVNDKYDLNDVQAILANKALADDIKSDITDTKRAEYLQEYNDFQAYREKAKEVATKAVAILEELKSKTDGGTATDSAASTTKSTETAASESSASSEATGTRNKHQH